MFITWLRDFYQGNLFLPGKPLPNETLLWGQWGFLCCTLIFFLGKLKECNQNSFETRIFSLPNPDFFHKTTAKLILRIQGLRNAPASISGLAAASSRCPQCHSERERGRLKGKKVRHCLHLGICICLAHQVPIQRSLNPSLISVYQMIASTIPPTTLQSTAMHTPSRQPPC